MNKRLTIIFVSIAVIIMTVVLGGVVFTVSEVTVAMADGQFDKAAIVEASAIRQGTSIFAIDEVRASENIERTFPSAKVVKIERVFPSQVRIEVVKRDAIMAMSVKDSSEYLILDREFKVVSVCDKDELADYEENLGYSLTMIDGFELSLEGSTSDVLGSFLIVDSGVLKGLSETVLALETYGNVNDRLCAMIRDFNIVGSGEYLTARTNLGVSLVVRLNITASIAEQMQVVYVRLDNLTNAEREKEWYIYVNDSGEVKYSSEIIF